MLKVKLIISVGGWEGGRKVNGRRKKNASKVNGN
jgi:hypothetical protein